MLETYLFEINIYIYIFLSISQLLLAFKSSINGSAAIIVLSTTSEIF
mgnify:CR=1 FL=1